MILLIQQTFFTPDQSGQLAALLVVILAAFSTPLCALSVLLTMKIRAAQVEFQAEQREKEAIRDAERQSRQTRAEDRSRVDGGPLPDLSRPSV